MTAIRGVVEVGVCDGTRTRFAQDHNLGPRPLRHRTQRKTEESNPRAFTPRPFSKRDAPPRRAVFLKLTRQDSNLNRLNQNQQCYRLHHGSSVRAEGFEPPVPEGLRFTARCDTPASPRTLGYPGRSRTCNLLRNRELLCQLSYGATCFVVAEREGADLPPRPTGFKPTRGPGSDPDRGVRRAPRATASRLPPACGHSCDRCTARTPQ